MQVHRISETVVHRGQITLTDLPFANGQRVQVTITDVPAEKCRSIGEVRQLLRGGVERYDDPTEPAIPIDSWEMLK